MKTRNISRRTQGLAALAMLAVFSVDVGATVIPLFEQDFGGFANDGVLTIGLAGDTDPVLGSGLDEDKLEQAPLAGIFEVTDFTASYDDDSPLTLLGPIVWSLPDLGGLEFDEPSMTLETLSAANLFTPPPYFLEFGTDEAAARGNAIDIRDIMGNVVASVPLPRDAVPLPPTLLLFGLGLLLVRRNRR